MSVDEIATSALDLDAGPERDGFLDQACGNDSELRQRVLSLIDALEQTDEGSFLKGGFLEHLGEQNVPVASQQSQDVSEDPAERFEIKSRHAMGGLGEVCVAWDRQLGREVALKRIRAEWCRDVDAAARFRREAEITGYLEHPGVVPIYSLGDQADGRPFYAMQFIKGRTLEDFVRESLGEHGSQESASSPGTKGKLRTLKRGLWYDQQTLRRVLDHVVDVCQTIDYAHSKQVIHRDLKPSNIMIGAYGQTLVVDWGLAKRLDQVESSGDESTDHGSMSQTLEREKNSDSTVDETRQGTTLGTPRFMSPEQASGEISAVGEAADIYCLGATLYFALTGQPPHSGERDLESTLQRIVRGEILPPRDFFPQLPGALEAIIKKAMSTAPRDRYSTAGFLASDIQRYLDDQPLAIYHDSLPERLLRWTRNHSVLAASITVAVLLTFLASIVGLVVRQQIDRRETEVARQQDAAERKLQFEQRKLQFEQQARVLEATATSEAALQRADVALQESRYADAADLIGVAADRMEDQPTMSEKRDQLLSRKKRLTRLGEFDSLRESGEDFDFLSRDTEAAILLQESLAKLGVWDSQTWWADLPDQDLSPRQRDRLQRQVYRVLTALNSLYVTKMVSAMGGGFEGGTPSMLKMFRSYVSSNIGTKEAGAAAELTRRIESYRPSQSAHWLGSIAGMRLHQNKRIETKNLGPPLNAADGMQMAVFSLIASVDPSYRNWFAGYGDAFLSAKNENATARCLEVALESLRRVSDEATDDYWIRLTLGQTYYLHAQAAQREDDFDAAIEFFELSRSEYGRCIAIRPEAPFGHADRSTVALTQALMIRDRSDHSSLSQQNRVEELLRTSLRDASQAKRLAPHEHWVYWHVGATAAALGQDSLATEAFLWAVELGFDVRGNTDGPVVGLDDLRGRRQAIEFAADRIDDAVLDSLQPADASRRLSLYAALVFSQGRHEEALESATRSVELDSTNLVAHRIAGWSQLRSGDWERSAATFFDALEIDSKDALSLIGAARIAETRAAEKDGIDWQESDAWYRAAAESATSSRHQAIAWIGIAKHAFRLDELQQAFGAISHARKLDPACDVTQFLELGRNQAKLILKESKKNPTKLPRAKALERIEQLRQFLDQIAQLPIASIKQILDSATQVPPRQLALLGGDFGLPLEVHWYLESISKPANQAVSNPASSRPPVVRITDGQHAFLQIKSKDPSVRTGHWSLSQHVPAVPNCDYQLQFEARSENDSQCSVSVAVYHGEDVLCEIPIPEQSFDWKNFYATFSAPSADQEFLDLEVRVLVGDLWSSVILLDDLSIASVKLDSASDSQ